MSSVQIEEVKETAAPATASSVPVVLDDMKRDVAKLLDEGALFLNNKAYQNWCSGVDALLTREHIAAAYLENRTYIEFAVDTTDTVPAEKMAVFFMRETVRRHNNTIYLTTSLDRDSKKEEDGNVMYRRLFRMWF